MHIISDCASELAGVLIFFIYIPYSMIREIPGTCFWRFQSLTEHASHLKGVLKSHGLAVVYYEALAKCASCVKQNSDIMVT